MDNTTDICELILDEASGTSFYSRANRGQLVDKNIAILLIDRAKYVLVSSNLPERENAEEYPQFAERIPPKTYRREDWKSYFFRLVLQDLNTEEIHYFPLQSAHLCGSATHEQIEAKKAALIASSPKTMWYEGTLHRVLDVHYGRGCSKIFNPFQRQSYRVYLNHKHDFVVELNDCLQADPMIPPATRLHYVLKRMFMRGILVLPDYLRVHCEETEGALDKLIDKYAKKFNVSEIEIALDVSSRCFPQNFIDLRRSYTETRKRSEKSAFRCVNGSTIYPCTEKDAAIKGKIYDRTIKDEDERTNFQCSLSDKEELSDSDGSDYDDSGCVSSIDFRLANAATKYANDPKRSAHVYRFELTLGRQKLKGLPSHFDELPQNEIIALVFPRAKAAFKKLLRPLGKNNILNFCSTLGVWPERTKYFRKITERLMSPLYTKLFSTLLSRHTIDYIASRKADQKTA
jgi:hypothetical protein